jgi:hypothetical protein
MHHLLSIAVNLVRSCRGNAWHPSRGALRVIFNIDRRSGYDKKAQRTLTGAHVWQRCC